MEESVPDVEAALETLVVSVVAIVCALWYASSPHLPVNNLLIVVAAAAVVSQLMPVVGTPPVCMFEWCLPYVVSVAHVAAHVSVALQAYACVMFRVPLKGSTSNVLAALALMSAILIVVALVLGVVSIFVRIHDAALAWAYTISTVLGPGLLASFIPEAAGLKGHPTPAATWRSSSRIIPVVAVSLTAIVLTTVAAGPKWLAVPRAPVADNGPSVMVCDAVFPSSHAVWKHTRGLRVAWQVLMPLASLALARLLSTGDVVALPPVYDASSDDDSSSDDGEEEEEESGGPDREAAAEASPTGVGDESIQTATGGTPHSADDKSGAPRKPVGDEDVDDDSNSAVAEELLRAAIRNSSGSPTVVADGK